MEIGIIGLPESGKTTVFNALTHGKADVGTFAASGPNVGVAKVPDPRLDALDGIFHPRRRVPAEVKYIDVAAPTRQELSGQFLAHLSQSDGLLHVVRAFESEKVPHIEGSVDAERDIGLVDMELAFSDMSIIERRLQKIEGQLKAAKPQEEELELDGVVLFCNKWCPGCRRARMWFENNNITFREYDVTRNQAAAKQVKEWTGGNLTTPTFYINGEVVIDWKMKEVSALLLD